MSQIGFVKAMKDFFGPLPGQCLCSSVLNSGPWVRTKRSSTSPRDFGAIGIDCADPDQSKVAA